MHNYHMTRRSGNGKTGKIPVTTTSAESCPDSCPLKGNGCYGELSYQGMHWEKVTRRERGGDLDELCGKIEALPDRQLWRHNVSGDLPGQGDKIDMAAVRKLVIANIGKRGYTYTHYPMADFDNRVAVYWANREGFTINLSANNLVHADNLADLNIAPVVTLLPAGQVQLIRQNTGYNYKCRKLNTVTPAGRTVIVCPATYKKRVTCATCKLCQKKGNRPVIGFPVHGSKSKAAQAVMDSAA